MKLRLLAATALAAGAMQAGEPVKQQPNIILIMLDDLSAKDLGCYGSTEHKTPVIDRMAREGVMFKTAWATPYCAPTRALLMTGRYPQHTKHWDNTIAPGRPIWQQHRLIGGWMGGAGYVSGMYGKAHFSEDPSVDAGFQDYAICRDWPGYDGPRRVGGKLDPNLYATPWYWHPAIIHNGVGVPTRPDDFGPQLECDFITRFIGRSADAKPFFVYHAAFLPHKWPATVTPRGPQWEYAQVPEHDSTGRATGARIPPAPPGTLADNLAWFDASMGRLIGSLERLGIADRTIIMLTADNGTAGYGKGKLTSEVALRVPFIVWGPGHVPARGPVDALIELTDVLPTLLDLAGRPPAKEAPLDGVSFAPLLRGEAFAGRQMIFSYSGTARWLRDARWMLDGTGKLWDCGDSRDDTRGYRDASQDRTPDALAARVRFEQRLRELPGPDPRDPEIGKAVSRWMQAHPEASR